MRNSAFIFFTSLFILAGYQSQAYQVSFQSNYKSGLAYLTYYMGSNLSIEDSAMVNSQGIAIFKNPRKLPGGVYSIVFPGKRYSADFLIDKEQVISIKSDTAHIENTIITGSGENAIFQQYQKFTAAKGMLLSQEKKEYLQSSTAADSAKHEAAYNKYNKELNDYRLNIIKTRPNSMMAALLNAMRDPILPTQVPKNRQDSLDHYNFYKSHYWDGITFMDDRIVRTPFFLPKLEKYYREVISQSPPDSIIKDIDYKLLLARTAPEMYKYLLNWFTDEYINPKYMGQDAVFVHLFEVYHSKGLTSWLNEKQMDIISRRAYMLMSNLIGEKAANLELLDTAGKVSALYDVQADYTVVIFWDPTCGHCKEELPKIDSVYQANWKGKNVKIYTVLTEKEHAEWIKYINVHNLHEWINVYQTKEMADAEVAAQKPGFRQLYDVTMTPTIYLLDKDKHIIGKKLTWQQISDLLDVKIHTAKQ